MKIHYINLDRSVGRKSYMETQLELLGLEYYRFSAVDGTKLSSQELDHVDQQDPRSSKLSDGAIAAFLSHLAVWKLIAGGSDNYGIVMEDDIYLTPQALFFLREESWIPDATPLIKLETTFAKLLLGKQRWTDTISGNRFKLLEYAINRTDGYEGGHGAGCYIVHSRYASWLVEHFTKFAWHVDAEIARVELFDRSSTNQLKNLPLQLVPAVAVQQICFSESFLPPDAEISTFDHRQRNSRNIPPTKKIVRELNRAFRPSNLKRRLLGQRVPLQLS